MKLLCKKIKSHTCLEIFQSTNDTNRRRHGALFQSFFGNLKMRRGGEEVGRKWYPKSTSAVKK